MSQPKQPLALIESNKSHPQFPWAGPGPKPPGVGWIDVHDNAPNGPRLTPVVPGVFGHLKRDIAGPFGMRSLR